MEIREINEMDLRTLAELDVSTFGDGDKEQVHKVFLHSFKNRIADACLMAEENGNAIGAVLVNDQGLKPLACPPMLKAEADKPSRVRFLQCLKTKASANPWSLVKHRITWAPDTAYTEPTK